MADNSSRKKRLKTGAACQACRTRKSRCDGIRPSCSNCQIREVACDYEPPRSQSRRPSYPRGPLSPGWTSRSPMASRAEDSLAEDAESSYLGHSTSFAVVSEGTGTDPPVVNAALPSTRQHLPTIGPIESCYEVPDRSLADRLIDIYFSRVHILYPFIHEGIFRAEYETVWRQPDEAHRRARLSWYGLLNMVFAHGSEPQAIDQVNGQSYPVTQFAKRSKDIVLFHHGLQSGTLEMVQTMLLMCYYLLGTTELEECWNLSGLMIRMATSIGLNLDLNSTKFRPMERELRKRVWWSCLVLDQSLSMKFGRLPTLSIDDTHLELPLEVDDQYLTDEVVVPTQPNAIPSVISFLVSAIKLAPVIRDMLKQLYFRNHTKLINSIDITLEPPSSKCHYILSTVILLDGKLQTWWESAPGHLTEEVWNRSTPWPGFTIQRMVQRVKFLHVRLLIHRSTLLYFSRHDIHDQLLRTIASSSTNACLDSARKIIRLVQAHHNQQQDLSSSYNAQLPTHVFSSLCVLQVVEKMDENKKITLDASGGFGNREDDYNAGIQILTSLSEWSDLATRYLKAIRQLGGGVGSGRPTDNQRQPQDAEVSKRRASQAPPIPQGIMMSPTSSGTYPYASGQFDFGEFDDILFSAGFLDPEFAVNELPESFFE